MMKLQMLAMEAFLAMIIVLPLLLIVKKWLFAPQKILYYIMFAFYLAAIYVAVGLPSVNYFRFDLNINAIPLKGIIGDCKNSILNIALFIPLGIALPLFWIKYNSIKSVMLFSFGFSLSIEFLQIFTYRATDINDLITNTFGAILGYVSVKYILKKQTFIRSDINDRDLFILGGTVLVVMFFIQPFFSSILWEVFYSM